MSFYQNLFKRIQSRKSKIGIIGMGYVGLPLAILSAKKKFNINCYERDLKRYISLKRKISYFTNIPSSFLKVFSKNTNIYNNFQNISECDIIILCLPTP